MNLKEEIEKFTGFESYMYTTRHLEFNSIKAYSLHEHLFQTLLSPPTEKGIEKVLEAKPKQTLIRPAIVNWLKYYSWKYSDKSYKNLELPEKIKKKKVSLPKFIHPNELKEIIQYSKLDNTKHLFIVMLIETGCRVTELLSLRVEDLNFDNNGRFIMVPNPIYGSGLKSGARTLNVSNYTKNLINFMIKEKNLTSNNKLIPFKDRYQAFYELKKICKKSINRNYSPHKFRHTFAIILYYLTRDITLVGRRMGHKSADVTAIYTQYYGQLYNIEEQFLPLFKENILFVESFKEERNIDNEKYVKAFELSAGV